MTIRLAASGGARLHAATQDGDAAKWSLLFPRGEWTGRNLAAIGGSIELGDEVFAEMVANWNAQERPALPVYWHHPPPIDSVPPAERKAVFRAAGHIEEMRVTERGLEARIAWSREGQAALDGDEYRFISPEWQATHPDRHTGEKRGWCVTGAALTDSPFFNEMPRVAASQSGPAPQESYRMDKKALCAALGLPEESTDEAVMECVAAMCKAKASAVETEGKLTASVAAVTAKDEALKAAHVALTEATATATAARAEVETLKASAKALEVSHFVDGLTGLGATAREAVKKYAQAMGLEEAKAFAAQLPTVPAGVVGVSGRVEDVADLVALKAAYDAELDAAQKSGIPVAKADAGIRKSPKFAPLFKE